MVNEYRHWTAAPAVSETKISQQFHLSRAGNCANFLLQRAIATVLPERDKACTMVPTKESTGMTVFLSGKYTFTTALSPPLPF